MQGGQAGLPKNAIIVNKKCFDALDASTRAAAEAEVGGGRSAKKRTTSTKGAGSGYSIGEPVRHCDGQKASKTDPHGNSAQLARPAGRLKITDTAREEFRSRVLRGVREGEKHDRRRSCAASIARTVFGLTRQIDPYPASHLAREQTWRERYRGIETDGLGVGFEQVQGQLACQPLPGD